MLMKIFYDSTLSFEWEKYYFKHPFLSQVSTYFTLYYSISTPNFLASN